MTAVKFLVTKINDKVDYIPIKMWDEVREIIQQALEMEKQQIIEAYIEGYSSNLNAGDSEKYYNETYKPST
jgi:hypothetical protein